MQNHFHTRSLRTRQRLHRGLSLLEVIIATAILAGSGMVLFSIIGMGSKYALRAEELTYSHHFAQTTLDEWMASQSPVGTEQTGSIEEAPNWSFRVQSQALDEPGLCLVTVEIFKTEGSLNASPAETPIYRLVRWVRLPQTTSTQEVGP